MRYILFIDAPSPARRSHFLLAPDYPALRLPRMDDQAARFLHRQNVLMASIAAFGFLTCTLLRQLGLPEGSARLLAFAVGFVLFATMVYSILRARKAISGDLAWKGAGWCQARRRRDDVAGLAFVARDCSATRASSSRMNERAGGPLLPPTPSIALNT